MSRWVRETLGYDDKWLVIIGIPLITIIINIIMFSEYLINDPKVFFLKLPIGMFYTGIAWFTLRPIIIWLMIRYPETNQAPKRICLEVVLGIIGYIFIKQILDLFFNSTLFDFLPYTHPAPYTDYFGALLLLFLVLAIYESIGFYTKLINSNREKEKLQRENIRSQLEGLKNQVNPHFLFNSLNTLSHLIPEDPDKAVNFVQKLSKVYRYILEIRDKKVIQIEEELEFLHSYIFLLKERFGENVQITCEVPVKYLRKKIVPLSLQILLENAIKHNIISTSKPLFIEVFVEDNKNTIHQPKLIVKNNLQKKNQVATSTKLGLENIKNRYQFFTDQPVDVITTTESFIVALPLIQRIPTATKTTISKHNL